MRIKKFVFRQDESVRRLLAVLLLACWFSQWISCLAPMYSCPNVVRLDVAATGHFTETASAKLGDAATSAQESSEVIHDCPSDDSKLHIRHLFLYVYIAAYFLFSSRICRTLRQTPRRIIPGYDEGIPQYFFLLRRSCLPHAPPH